MVVEYVQKYSRLYGFKLLETVMRYINIQKNYTFRCKQEIDQKRNEHRELLFVHIHK